MGRIAAVDIMTIETPDLIDALPYIDTAIDEDKALREFVKKLIDYEMKESHIPQDHEFALPKRPFLTCVLRNELARREQHQQRQDETRELAEIKTDTPPPHKSDMEEDELGSWMRCLDQVKIKLEYRQRQLSSLEILKTCGNTACERYLAWCERMKSVLDQELELLDAKIRDVNAKRKASQEQISRHLDVLQTNWDNLSIRNQMLSEEIDRLVSEISART